MIIGAADSQKRNEITVPELIAVLKAAAKIPTCVQYAGVLHRSNEYVFCELHFYCFSTLGCKAWTEENGPVAFAPRRFKGWNEVNSFIADIFSAANRRHATGKDSESNVSTVYYPGGDTPLTPLQLATEAGPSFRASDYPARITGKMCDCENGGEFDLLPKDHPDVIEGGKRYMICRVCGCSSHL